MTQVMAFPWLCALVGTPALGALVVGRLACPRRSRRAALLCAGATAAIALGVLAFGRSAPLVDPLGLPGGAGWLPLLGVDGLSALLAGMVTLLTCAVLGAGSTEPRSLARALWAESATLVALCTIHPELLLVGWGASVALLARDLGDAPGRARHARVLLAYQVPGLAALLLAYLLGRAEPAADRWQALASGAALWWLVLAIGLRQALAPLHSWFLAAADGTPGLMALFVAPQLGSYLIVRALLPLGSRGSAALLTLGSMALGAALLGALLALVQREPRRAIACVALSQSATVPAGLALAGGAPLAGAALTWLSLGVTIAGLLLAIGAVEARVGRLDLARSAGLARRLPRLALLFLLLGLALVGVPGTLGFAGEDLLFGEVLEGRPWAAALLVVTTALNGITVVRVSFRLFSGSGAGLPPVGDLLARERVALTALVLAAVVGGLFPGPILVGMAQAAPRTLAPPQAR